MTDAPQARADADATRRVLRWLLGGQVALAVLLVLIDFAPSIPGMISPTSAPELDQPVRPGDQTRHYRMRRPTSPGPGVSEDMPRRLVASPATVDGRDALQLRGAIEQGDGQRIAADLRRQSPALVTLDSPGGSVTDALEIGRALREVGAATHLDDGAVCFSACPYIFAAGTERRIAESGRLGVHQHRFGESTILPAFMAVEDIQRGQAGVLDYLSEMGIDLRIMGPAMSTPADEIYILTREELEEWDVVTE